MAMCLYHYCNNVCNWGWYICMAKREFWWIPIHWAHPIFHNHVNCALNICFVLQKHDDAFGLESFGLMWSLVTHLFAHGNCFASSINLVVFRFDEDLEVFILFFK